MTLHNSKNMHCTSHPGVRNEKYGRPQFFIRAKTCNVLNCSTCEKCHAVYNICFRGFEEIHIFEQVPSLYKGIGVNRWVIWGYFGVLVNGLAPLNSLVYDPKCSNFVYLPVVCCNTRAGNTCMFHWLNLCLSWFANRIFEFKYNIHIIPYWYWATISTLLIVSVCFNPILACLGKFTLWAHYVVDIPEHAIFFCIGSSMYVGMGPKTDSKPLKPANRVSP